jgi:hypothetical protein
VVEGDGSSALRLLLRVKLAQHILVHDPRKDGGGNGHRDKGRHIVADGADDVDAHARRVVNVRVPVAAVVHEVGHHVGEDVAEHVDVAAADVHADKNGNHARGTEDQRAVPLANAQRHDVVVGGRGRELRLAEAVVRAGDDQKGNVVDGRRQELTEENRHVRAVLVPVRDRGVGQRRHVMALAIGVRRRRVGQQDAHRKERRTERTDGLRQHEAHEGHHVEARRGARAVRQHRHERIGVTGPEEQRGDRVRAEASNQRQSNGRRVTLAADLGGGEVDRREQEERGEHLLQPTQTVALR